MGGYFGTRFRAFGRVDLCSGVGGGVSGLNLFERTGNARFCGGNLSNNSLNADLLAFSTNGSYRKLKLEVTYI